jgi:single-stranded DNA-binding protein
LVQGGFAQNQFDKIVEMAAKQEVQKEQGLEKETAKQEVFEMKKGQKENKWQSKFDKIVKVAARQEAKKKQGLQYKAQEKETAKQEVFEEKEGQKEDEDQIVEKETAKQDVFEKKEGQKENKRQSKFDKIVEVAAMQEAKKKQGLH